MHIAEVVTIAKSLPLLRLNTYKSLILSYSADYRRIFSKNLCKGNKKHPKTKYFELLKQEKPAKTWNIKNKIVYLWQKWKDNENDKRLYYHTSQIPEHQS